MDPNQQQQHQFGNIIGNQNFQFVNPSYTPNLVGQPSTSHNNNGFAIPQNYNSPIFNGMSSADVDFGLMNQPRATQVTSDQSMSSKMDFTSLDFILSLSGDLNKLSVSDLNIPRD